ncbi:MAG: putative rane-associated protein-like protein [Geobacteraceae bacterium]|nr:putative rane-associated protein-like protein [Geobacteraceae bacterium]
MQELFRQYLETYGYIFLFLGTFLEGEAVLILAGYFAFQARLNIVGVILTAFAGSFLGDQFYFHLGRWRGLWLINLFPVLARKSRRGLKLVEKYGALVAFISRYTYGFRILLPVILGMTNLSKIKFLYLNIASALTWAAAFSMLGYLFGKTASFIIEDLDRYEPYIILALSCFIGCMWLAHFVHIWWLRRPARQRLKRIRQSPSGKLREEPHTIPRKGTFSDDDELQR